MKKVCGRLLNKFIHIQHHSNRLWKQKRVFLHRSSTAVTEVFFVGFLTRWRGNWSKSLTGFLVNVQELENHCLSFNTVAFLIGCNGTTLVHDVNINSVTLCLL
jgi:hypothetical protein